MELSNLSKLEIKNIDTILNHSKEYGVMELYGLMVDLWQNGIAPENVGWCGTFLNPQLKTFTHTKEGSMIYSAYFTEKVNYFNTRFVLTWFNETYPAFHHYLQLDSDGDNPRYSDDHIADYSEFRFSLIETYMELYHQSNPYFFSFLPEEWHDEYFANLPVYDKSAATQYLKDNDEDFNDYTKEALDKLFELTEWQKKIKN